MFQSSNKFTLARDNVILLIDHERKIEGSPIFSTPNAFALLSLLFSSLLHTSPVFFHHLSYRICITPFSCSSKIARDILSLQGEPAYKTASLSHEFLRSFSSLKRFTSSAGQRLEERWNCSSFLRPRGVLRDPVIWITLSFSLFLRVEKKCLVFIAMLAKNLAIFDAWQMYREEIVRQTWYKIILDKYLLCQKDLD